MLVIVYEKKGEHIRFWTGSTWQGDYADAAKYENLAVAYEVVEDNPRVAAKWTRIIANYGTDAEHTAKTSPSATPRTTRAIFQDE